jgi:hypothetical protein
LHDIKLIDIQDIIDYKKLKTILFEEFAVDINFEHVHCEFLEKNQSLQNYTQANLIINAVKNNKSIEIKELSVVGEAEVFYELEKYYFDIPFFNLINFFKNTQDVLNYVKHYPDFMRQPNKLYHQYHKRFPNPYIGQ